MEKSGEIIGKVEEILRWFAESVDFSASEDEFLNVMDEVERKLGDVIEKVVFAPIVLTELGFVYEVGSFSKEGKVFDVYAIFSKCGKKLRFEKVEIEERGKPSAFTLLVFLGERLEKALEEAEDSLLT